MWKSSKITQRFGKKSAQAEYKGYGLEYIQHWVNDLSFQLDRFSNDSDFVMDLLESAGKHFTISLSEKVKRDAFLYILGSLAREKATNNDL